MVPSLLRRHGFSLVLGACVVALVVGLALVLLTDAALNLALGVALITGAWIPPVLYAVRYRTRAQFRPTASADDVRKAQKATVSSVENTRKALTTSQARQDRTLVRIEQHLRSLTADSQARSFQVGESGIDVLFVTSNGAGLGHISRSLAIARQLPEAKTCEILTLSKAYRQVAGQGVTIHYFPSSGATGETSLDWNRHFRAYLLRLMEKARPGIVVFDGTWVYTAITEVCRMRGTRLVWMQRGMWQKEVDATSVQRHAAAKVVDHVIVPGDYAEKEYVDSGPGIVPKYVGPIVMTSEEDLVSRDAACTALGLDPKHRYVLLNLGGGGVSDPDSIATTFHQILAERSSGIIPVQVISPLSDTRIQAGGTVHVNAYPIMKYARAFEFMISAAGYNSAQESVSLGIPTILVPNTKTRTDDQVRRADLLAAQGLCLTAKERTEMDEAVVRMLDPASRAMIRRQLEMLEKPSGASEAAAHIEELLAATAWVSKTATLDRVAIDGYQSI